jgi:methylated-DNA-[protein]-cysteine S-methyltransferase
MSEMCKKPTDFEESVYDAVRLVPAGRVVSYGEIARQISRGNARAVGTALSKNPYAPEVPCHRVVRADGTLGGFFGETEGPQIRAKAEMLEKEGVLFIAPGKVAPSAFIS